MDLHIIVEYVEMAISFIKNMLAQKNVQAIFDRDLVGKKVTCFTSEGKIEGKLLGVSEEGILQIEEPEAIVEIPITSVRDIIEYREIVSPFPLSQTKSFEDKNITVVHSTGKYIGKCLVHSMSYVQLVESDGSLVEIHGDMAIIAK